MKIVIEFDPEEALKAAKSGMLEALLIEARSTEATIERAKAENSKPQPKPNPAEAEEEQPKSEGPTGKLVDEKAPWDEEQVIEDVPLETVRALVVSSKKNKEKGKSFMVDLGIKKLTDLNQEQLNALYAALKEA